MHSSTVSPRSSRMDGSIEKSDEIVMKHPRIVEKADDSDPPKQTSTAQPAQEGKVDSMQTWVVLLAQQRSGIHWLTEQLNQHACIDIKPEILCCNHTTWWPPKLRKMAIQRFFDPAAVPSDMVVDGKKMPWVVEKYVQESAFRLARGRSIRGFNWKIDQGFLNDWPDWFRPYAVNHSIRILWVQRRNLLRRLVSGYANAIQHLAATTDQSMVKTVAKQKIKIEPKMLLRHLNESSRENDGVSRYLKSNAIQYLHVYYEDLLNGLDDVWAFILGGTACKVPTVKVASHYQQLHSGKLEKFVQNWDEVQAALSGTQWSHMLVE